jgi:hypothetical protein
MDGGVLESRYRDHSTQDRLVIDSRLGLFRNLFLVVSKRFALVAVFIFCTRRRKNLGNVNEIFRKVLLLLTLRKILFLVVLVELPKAEKFSEVFSIGVAIGVPIPLSKYKPQTCNFVSSTTVRRTRRAFLLSLTC